LTVTSREVRVDLRDLLIRQSEVARLFDLLHGNAWLGSARCNPALETHIDLAWN